MEKGSKGTLLGVYRRSSEAEGNPLHRSYTRERETKSCAVRVDGLSGSFDWHRDKQVKERGEVTHAEDRAILCQFEENVDELKRRFPAAVASLAEESCFGENLRVVGVGCWETICVGDRFAVRDVVLEVSAPRWPCYKVDKKHPVAKETPFEERVRAVCVSTGLGGVFMRVVHEGSIEEGDSITLVARPYPQWTVLRVSALFYGGVNRKTAMLDVWQGTEDELQQLRKLEVLSPFEWRERLERYVKARKITVITLNVWGLPDTVTGVRYGMKYGSALGRKERMAQIAQKLNRSGASIVCLQELWLPADKRFIATAVRDKFPFSIHFQSGIFNMGGGLTLLSKWPIVESSFVPYSLNGKPQRIHHGDWWGGKGVAYAQVRHPDGTLIDVYTTHLIAEYHIDDENQASRDVQMLELVDIVQGRQPAGDLVCICGDFNASPDMAIVQLARSLWLDALPRDDNVITLPCDHDGKSKKLDYIFFKSSENRFGLETSKVCFRGRKAGVQYSDHYGVKATWSLERGAATRVVRLAEELLIQSEGDDDDDDDNCNARAIAYQAYLAKRLIPEVGHFFRALQKYVRLPLDRRVVEATAMFDRFLRGVGSDHGGGFIGLEEDDTLNVSAALCGTIKAQLSAAPVELFDPVRDEMLRLLQQNGVDEGFLKEEKRMLQEQQEIALSQMQSNMESGVTRCKRREKWHWGRFGLFLVMSMYMWRPFFLLAAILEILYIFIQIRGEISSLKNRSRAMMMMDNGKRRHR